MEDEKKKKKNKKKKNKQATKPTESVTLDSTEPTSDNRSHASEMGQDKNGQSSGARDAPDDIGVNTDTDRDVPTANGTQEAHLTNSEKKYWLDREASFHEKIKELQAEKDAKIQIEAVLEEKIKQLLKEKDENLQKQASQEENISQLHADKIMFTEKEGSLEQKIQQLLGEKDAYLQKEAGLEMKIRQLQSEKDSWLQKEISLEEKINQLVDETAVLNLNVVSLQEKIRQMERERDSWVVNENSSKELIASMNSDNSQLQSQVTELEHLRKSLLEENQQLTENITILQSRISYLESANKMTSEDGDLNYQIETARALIDKLIAENSELVEKVNELYGELDQSRAVKTEDSLSVGSFPGAIAAAQTSDYVNTSAPMPIMDIVADDRHGTAQAADSIPEVSKMMPVVGSTESLEDVMIKDQRNGMHVSERDGSGPENSSEITEADEIVPISIDGNDVPETNLEVAQDHENNDVPLTDAPLIGAPFRLISFFARYVSGADLVNKNTGN